MRAGQILRILADSHVDVDTVINGSRRKSAQAFHPSGATRIQPQQVALNRLVNAFDAKALAPTLRKVRERFHVQRLVLVGDRGMLTEARIREALASVEGLDWITALRAPAIQALVESGTLQLSLFDPQDLAEITHAAYPGERLIVCKNPLLADDQARKRRARPAATEQALEHPAAATRRAKRPLRGKARIGVRVGKVLGQYKVDKPFTLAHVFLCMLAYYVEWHMRVALKPLLFHDNEPAAGETLRPSVVAPAQRPPRATTKAETKRTAAGSPSFQTLLADLATLTKNRVQPKAPGSPAFDVITTPTDLQRRTFELLGTSPRL